MASQERESTDMDTIEYHIQWNSPSGWQEFVSTTSEEQARITYEDYNSRYPGKYRLVKRMITEIVIG